MAAKSEEKKKLAPLLTELTSRLPEGSKEREGLQSQLDGLGERWSDLSGRLGQCQANLDSAFDMASTHESSTTALTPWVPDTLEHLQTLGPPPADPEKVQKLKAEIEVRTYVCVYSWP